MARQAFVLSTPLARVTNRSNTATCERSALVMKAKGSRSKRKERNANKSSKQNTDKFANDGVRSTDAGGSSEPFVPRGTTLRQEYERKGVIEPTFNPDAGTLPEIVANRMLRRIIGFGGVPFSIFFLFFAAYFVLKYKYDITVLPVVVAYSTLGTIGLATVGITYGIFSSSWDEEVEGSFMGWEQVSKNFMHAKDGLLGAREREIRDEELVRLSEMVDKDGQD